MRRRVVISASLLLLGTGLLAGCGQKGPLFLPTKPATAASASSVPAPAASAATPAPATTSAAPAPASSSGD
ncbi:MAG TPA: lipoprotein [Rhodanobacteraceae bacterium]|nr:lipoprotein [Rhodanobacteraceae bacterium]